MKIEMIKLKYFYPRKGEMEICLGISVSHYSGTNVDIGNYAHGIKWLFAGKEIEIIETNTTIYGYPDPFFEKILTVNVGSGKYPYPANAVIYNLDGSVHRVLDPPILIGKLASYSTEPVKGDYFGGLLPGWRINSKGEKVLVVSVKHQKSHLNIRYGDFYEVREVDVETGEFGEVLSEGMI